MLYIEKWTEAATRTYDSVNIYVHLTNIKFDRSADERNREIAAGMYRISCRISVLSIDVCITDGNPSFPFSIKTYRHGNGQEWNGKLLYGNKREWEGLGIENSIPIPEDLRTVLLACGLLAKSQNVQTALCTPSHCIRVVV